MKPTRGRTPSGPKLGEGWNGMSTIHAVSRSVRDSAVLLDVSSGPEAGAPYWAPPQERPYAEEVSRDPGRLRIAVQLETFNGAQTHSDCVDAVESTAELCRSLGHEVVPAKLDIDAAELGAATQLVISAHSRVLVDEGAAALGREAEPGDVENLTWAMTRLVESRSAADYVRATRVLHASSRSVARFLSDYDLILTPTLAVPPLPLGELSLNREDAPALLGRLMESVGYTQLFNASGNPAMSVPLHWNAAGLPIGVQFAARFGDEATLFRLAAQLEAARPWPRWQP